MSVFPIWGWSAHITTQDYDDTPDAGTMERAARADHRHGMPAAGGGGGGGEAFPVGSVFVAVVATDPATLLGYGTWAAFAAGRVLIGRDPGDTDFDTALETGGAKSRAISAHSGATVGDHAAQSHSAHSGTAVGTSGAGSSHTHTGPSHQHTYTDVVNHVHVQSVNTASTGGLSGYTADTSTNTSAASGYSTANPTGGVATGTTAAGGTGATGAESAHTHAAGTVTQPAAHSDHAALSHTVGQPAAHSDVNVVQPYIVVYMWERTA